MSRKAILFFLPQFGMWTRLSAIALQKKFRARQKEKMRTSQKQLDELTRQVSVLLSEKSQLETRTRILEQVVYLNTNHEQMLHANEVGPQTCLPLAAYCSVALMHSLYGLHQIPLLLRIHVKADLAQ